MSAGSGLLLPGLGDLITEASRRPGVLAVLDAADLVDGQTARLKSQAVAVEETLAAAVGYYSCPCGIDFEFDEHSTLEDYAALNRWLGAHFGHEAEVGP